MLFWHRVHSCYYTARGTVIHSVLLLRTLMSTLSYGKIQASWSTVEEVRPIHLELDGEYCFSKPISGLHMCISNRSYYGQKRAVKNEDFVDRTHHTTMTSLSEYNSAIFFLEKKHLIFILNMNIITWNVDVHLCFLLDKC